jgi:asparagine synthetase B (glutamine-hydrolysing)
VVKFSWRVPLALKVQDGKSKWLLREVLYHYVPRELMERPKMGFGVPIDAFVSRTQYPHEKNKRLFDFSPRISVVSALGEVVRAKVNTDEAS